MLIKVKNQILLESLIVLNSIRSGSRGRMEYLNTIDVMNNYNKKAIDTVVMCVADYQQVTNKIALRFFIQEDAKANGIKPGLIYWFKLFYGNTPARAFRFLKSLRRYEYGLNTNSLMRYWYRLRTRRLGARYNIAILPNTVG